jgi:serine/threonine protein phosphatase 1
LSEKMSHRRHFAIGDIHGCDQALDSLLNGLDLTADDLVIVLGDAIDRGPGSRRVLKRLIKLDDTSQLVYIRGNHEEMMLDALEGNHVDEWLRHGGAATVSSYGGSLDDIPDDHWDLLESSSKYWEGPNDICVHANLKPGVELHEQRSSWLRWRKLTGDELPHHSGKRVVCGHSGVGFGAPTFRNGWVCLDTNAYCGGILTALELGSGEILQARQSGEFRRGFYLHEIESKIH